MIINWGERKIVYQLLNYLFHLIFPYKSVWLSIRNDPPPLLLGSARFSSEAILIPSFSPSPTRGRTTSMQSHPLHVEIVRSYALQYITFSKTIFFIFRPSLIYYQHCSWKMSKFGKDPILHNYQKKFIKFK